MKYLTESLVGALVVAVFAVATAAAGTPAGANGADGSTG